MNKIYTPEDYLFLLAYSKTSDKKCRNITDKLSLNDELFHKYQSIGDAKNILDNNELEPSESAINNIMNYSKALNVFKFKPDVNNSFIIVN